MTDAEVKEQILAHWDEINQWAKKGGYNTGDWYAYIPSDISNKQFWLKVDGKEIILTQKEWEDLVNPPHSQLLALGSGILGGLCWYSRNPTLKWVGVGGSALASYAFADAEYALGGSPIYKTLAVSASGAAIVTVGNWFLKKL